MTRRRPRRRSRSAGERRVPVPDPIARDYLLLALRLDQHAPGLVDGYFGPADLKAPVDLEQLRPPAALADDAAALRDRLDAEVDEPDRRGWLAVQLVGARDPGPRAGRRATLPYVELDPALLRLGAGSPRRGRLRARRPTAIDALLPGPGAARRPPRRLGRPVSSSRRTGSLVVLDWLVDGRPGPGGGIGRAARTTRRSGSGSSRNQPWTGYNWYDGGRRSRFDVNTDLPIRAPDLVHLAAHEAYPGHHLEHAWKEAELVERLGRLEASVLLINTPECLISEGLADLGHEFVSPAGQRAGPARRALRARRAADRRGPGRRPRRRRARRSPSPRCGAGSSESRVNAALMRHADGALPRRGAAPGSSEVGRFAPDVAAKRLEFIEHPLWRTYVFVYHEGEALLRRWLDAVPPADRPARFGRLLREQLWPSAIAAEIAPASARTARLAGAGPSGFLTDPSSARCPRGTRSRSRRDRRWSSLGRRLVVAELSASARSRMSLPV